MSRAWLPPGPPLVRWACVAGAALVLGTSALGRSWGVVPFALWALVPWVAARFLPRLVRDPWATSAAALALLAAEAAVRAAVFLFPSGSTSAILLVFSPLYLLGVLPVGLGVGWALGAAWRRAGAIGRAAIVLAGCALAALAAVAAFAPGALPSGMARAVSARERIGPPRVVAGAGWLRPTLVADRSGWYQAGDFDDEPGDEVAEVAERAVVLRDPLGLAEKGRRPLAAEARRRWSWSSRLVRDGTELVVVDEGGGFQDVALWDLNGTTRFQFRPDVSLPPVAMLPGDLDGDGAPEFYAASGATVYRLDRSGRVVASMAAPGGVDALAVHAGPGGGRIAAMKHGAAVRLWDVRGQALGTLEVPREDYRYRFVDWPEPFSLVGGPHAVTVVDPAGRVRLRHELGDFALSDAAAVRWAGEAFLAVLAVGPRDLGLNRLIVFDPQGAVAYDEVLARGAHLLAARAAGGADTRLFLAGGGLVAYDRPVAPAAAAP